MGGARSSVPRVPIPHSCPDLDTGELVPRPLSLSHTQPLGHLLCPCPHPPILGSAEACSGGHRGSPGREDKAGCPHQAASKATQGFAHIRHTGGPVRPVALQWTPVDQQTQPRVPAPCSLQKEPA